MTCCREERWGRSERPSCFYYSFKLLQLKLWICHGAIFGGSMSWIPSLVNDEQTRKLRNVTQTLISNHFSMGMLPLLDAAAAAKSLQSCLTLCDPIDGSPPGSPIPGILQARTLEWVAIAFSNAWKWKVKVKSLSRVWLLATPWTAAYQVPPSMGFSRQEYWIGVPLPSPAFGWQEAKSGGLFLTNTLTHKSLSCVSL